MKKPKPILPLDPYWKGMEGDLVMIDSETGESVKDLPGDRLSPMQISARKVWARMEEEENK